jgi:hypothetical protein
MTVALGGQRGRDNGYFEKFEQGTAQWYHLPQSTFLQKFRSILPIALSTISRFNTIWRKKCQTILWSR